MVRIIIKGGVWKNTEDEVLKAAIAKYGKNQWARISSLLVRKTPKQCKARWYEWLDPSIKKTEWSKEEDEKLLHLAKLMPTQWRTIAPIVGRTATQCLERYQKLLDEAEAKENEELGLAGPGDAGPSSEDVRRLRPGEIDPDPETKPARPDPIDMDEDEKEMLSEARARLANTQGKKAKRKARERQLEEARRLAVLQKRRELKAAGIIMRSKQKKKGMDYNADIPFEKKPAPGFYDTSEEQAHVGAAPVGQTLRRLENKRKPDAEEEERKKRQKREGPQQTKFVPAREAQIAKLKEAESIGRRSKLVLPAAQVGETELEEIVKIGRAGEAAKGLVGGTDDPTGQLIGEYDSLERAKMARTPRTAPQQDNIMLEARNLRNMTVQQTPLLGDENTPLHAPSNGGTGFEGATPRHQVAFTPNPLATPRDIPDASVAGTPMRTPMRDSLKINPNDGTFVGDTPRDARLRATAAKRSLKASFMSLPRPENNFELLVPDEEEAEGDEAEVITEEDAAERDARLARLREEEERRALARRSQPVRLALPRPPNVDVEQLLADLQLVPADETVDERAQRLIDYEIAQLIKHDSLVYPVPGTSNPGGTESTYELPPDDDIELARNEVARELASTIGFPDAPSEQVKSGILALTRDTVLDEDLSWTSLRGTLAYDAAERTWKQRDELSEQARIAGWAAQIEEARGAMAREAARAGKLEKKLGITLGGYMKRSTELTGRLNEAFANFANESVDRDSFSRLKVNEDAAGPIRVAALREDVEKLERRERSLQAVYAELSQEREETEKRVAALEERAMAEAEALNEAALAAAEA